jgi:hypothetical protein
MSEITPETPVAATPPTPKNVAEMLTETDNDFHDGNNWKPGLYAEVAPIEVIGEHSSGNDPWVNALDMVTPAAEVDRFRSVAYTQASMISELTSACMAAETERDRLKAELAEMESAAADWAARLAELRGKAETRLVELAEVESTYRKVGNKAGAARQDYAAAEIRSLFGIEWKPRGGEPRD